MAGPIRISILADGSRARREMGSTGRVGTSMGRTLAKAGRIAAVGLGVGLTAAAAAGVKFVEAAAEDEKAAKLLEGQLKRNAGATDAQVASTERWITAQGKALGVTDDELRPALSKLVTATHDVGKAQDLATIAMDASAATGKDLNTVSLALMKAQNGQVSSLSRLGINTKNAAGETLTMSAVTKRMAEQFGGAAQERAGTLSGRLDRLKVTLSETAEAVGKELLPVVADLAPFILKGVQATIAWGKTNIVPKLRDLAKWVGTNKAEIGDMAATVRDSVVPVLKTTATVVKDVVSFFVQLPGPVKEFGIQAAIATAVVVKFAPAMTAAKLATSGFITNVRSAETRTTALGNAARGAAGVGGLLLLSTAASTANTDLKLLSATAGGAALGFSVGGPWGAAIGTIVGLVGAVSTLPTPTSRAADAMRNAQQPATEYASALDSVSGAAKRSANDIAALALQQSGALEAGRTLGLSTRDLTRFVLGHEGAIRRVNAAIDAQAAGDHVMIENGAIVNRTISAGAQAADLLSGALGRETSSLAESQRKTRELSVASGELGRKLQDVQGRSKIVARVDSKGFPETSREVARLTRGLNLTPKQIRTVIKATGADATVKQVQRLLARMKEVQAARGDAPKFAPGVRNSVNAAEREASRGGDALRRLLEGPLKKTKGEMPRLSPDIRAAVRTASGIAGPGGRGIGNALKTGTLQGVAGLTASLSGAIASAVRAAIAAGRAAAKAQSPSRETMKLGKDLGDGLVLGLAKTQPRQERAGRDLIESVLGGVTRGSQGVEKALDRIRSIIEKTVKLKNDKAEAAREREILKHLKDRFNSLTELGKAQDKLNAKLDKEKQNLADLKTAAIEYATGIRDAIVATGDITTLGKAEDGTVSLSALLSELKGKVAAAARFSALLQQLSKAKLSKVALQQLIDAGPDAGLATAEAIAAGGAGAIAEVNSLTAQLVSTGQTLGNSMSHEFHAAGIAAQAGLVAGLIKDTAALELAARRLAMKLANAIKKALGIASPSRVFMDIGDNALKGLAIGLDETRAKSIGSTTARSLVKGFGSPSLVKGFGTPALASVRAGGAVTGGPGPSVVNIRVEVAPGTHPAEVGRQIQSHLDAYYRTGGKPAAL